MSYADIAAVLGVPLGTVKTRVHHAKRLLAHALGRRLRPPQGRLTLSTMGAAASASRAAAGSATATP